LNEAMENREALMEAEDNAAIDRIARKAKDSAEACLAELSLAFRRNDIEGADRLATRLRYWQKLAEEARGKRRLMEGTAI